MLSYEEFLKLKEEKLRLESENLKLRGELLTITKSNHVIQTETEIFFEINIGNQENLNQSKIIAQNDIETDI